MKTVEPLPDCPRGLEYFSVLDKIIIQQEVNIGNGEF